MCVANVSALCDVQIVLTRITKTEKVVTVNVRAKRDLHLLHIFCWRVSVPTLFKQSWIKFSRCVFV